MIIGIISTVNNELLNAGKSWRFEYFGTHHGRTFPQLYPDEDFYYINVIEPDFDMIDKCDLIYYQSGTVPNKYMVKIIDNIKPPIVCYLEGGLTDIMQSCLEDLLDFSYIMDKSRIVSFGDEDTIKNIQPLTSTEVVFFPLPYPVHLVQELKKEFENLGCFISYDILIPYGFSITHATTRNGISTLLVCKEFIEQYNNLSVAVIEHRDVDGFKEFVKRYGLPDNFVPLAPQDHTRYLELNYRCKFVMSLNYRMVSGRNAIDAAMFDKPYVGSRLVPDVKYLYGGIDNVFDIPCVLANMTKALKYQGIFTINKGFYDYLSYDYARKRLEELI
jgi:hypothetical protein